jgi:hypothetical protein
MPLVLVLAAASADAIASLPTTPVTDDLWDVHQGAVVTGHSSTDGTGTDAIAMFGGSYGSWEPENVMFQDGHSQPYVHWVEWTTPNPVTIGAFNLFASPDGDVNHPGNPAYARRSFTTFHLYAWNGTNFQSVYNLVPTYYGWYFTDVELPSSVTASRWRAEFDQQVRTNSFGGVPAGYYGPRIIELDGFVPEPATAFLLLASGLLLCRPRSRA